MNRIVSTSLGSSSQVSNFQTERKNGLFQEQHLTDIEMYAPKWAVKEKGPLVV